MEVYLRKDFGITSELTKVLVKLHPKKCLSKKKILNIKLISNGKDSSMD